MGIRLAQGAGAGLRGTPHADNYADAGIDAIGMGYRWNYIKEIPEPIVIGGFATIAIKLGRQPLLKVNKYAKRFMNEDESWTNKVAAEPVSDEAKAGKTFVDANCGICHTVPSKENFGDMDTAEQIVAEFSNHDLMSFPEEDMLNVAAWVAER